MRQSCLSHILIPTFFYFRCRLAGSGTPSSFLTMRPVPSAATTVGIPLSMGKSFTAQGARVGEVGLLRMPNTTPVPPPFRDVTQSAPAPRVRTSRPEVWAPEAQPFPAREALAPPVSVGTERGGVEESRRLKLVVRCGAASPPCVIMKSSVPPDPERKRRARGAGTPFDLFLEKFAVLSRRNTSRLATCFTDLHL